MDMCFGCEIIFCCDEAGSAVPSGGNVPQMTLPPDDIGVWEMWNVGWNIGSQG